MRRRSWRWLHTRIQGLLAEPDTRIARALRPPPTTKARPPHGA